MSSVEIRRVADKKDLKAFIEFHYELYEGNPYDAPNLYSDEVHTFSKDKNSAFEFCEAEYFLAYKDGKLVGRVAAIINHRYNKQWERPAVRFGWLDLIDDIEVLRALLGAVEDYGRSKGMKEIIGPLGFTDMDPEGMLTYGFDQLGTMATSYNYEYYPKLHVPDLKRSQVFGPEQYGQKVLDVVNKTFAHLYGFSQMTQRQKDEYVQMYFKFFSMDMLCVIEDWNTPNHDVIGVGISIPSLTKALQKCRKGRLFPFGWWHVIRALKFHMTDVVDLLLVGILPEYRAKGANALLFYKLIPVYQKYGFKWGETHVEMETNSKVQGQWAYLENEQHKRRRCYKKAL